MLLGSDGAASSAGTQNDTNRRRSGLTRLASRSGASVRFSNLSVDLKGRRILNGVSGFVNRGEVLAVMGPSGSGKTTLFNVLSGRLGSSSGEILLDNQPLSKQLRRQMCYVLQNDLMFPYLTLYETFKYAALLRLPQEMRYESKMAAVEEVMDVLGVRHCQNTIIGNHIKRGLSGGEKKRASIGQELLANPRLLVMDEPTSGLDSHIAHSLMVTIQDLAVQHGRTIITSIHQPSSQIFHLFDKLLLMAGGQVVYFGPGKDAVDHFSRLGYACPPNYNPADYLLDAVSNEDAVTKICSQHKMQPLALEGSPPAPAEDVDQVGSSERVLTEVGYTDHVPLAVQMSDVSTVAFCPSPKANGGKRSPPLATIEEGPAVQVKMTPKASGSDDQDDRWASSFQQQLSVLMRRSFKNSRSEILSLVNFVQTCVLIIVSALVWFRTPKAEDHIRDITGYLFFMAVFFGFQPIILATGTFLVERAIINRERASGYYRLSSYFLAKSLSELPLSFVLPSFYLAVTFPIANLGGFVMFLQIWGFLLLSVLVSQSYGQFIGALAPNLQKAITTSATIMIAFLLTGGFYVSKFSPSLSWLRYLSYITFTYNGFARIVFDSSAQYACAPNNPGSPYSQCLGGPVNATTNATISGADITRELGADAFELGWSSGVLIAYLVVLRLLTYAMLRFVRKPGSV